MNKIHNMDNLIGMDQLILDGVNVNLIIADPPYVISKESQFHTMKDRKILVRVQRSEIGMKNLIIDHGLKNHLKY